MRPPFSILLALVLIPAISSGNPSPGSGTFPKNTGPSTAERITDAEFIARRAASADAANPVRHQPARPKGYGLLEMSAILHHGQQMVFLPKDSILHCPQEHEARRSGTVTGRPVDWITFLAANRSWLATFEVTREQIIGQKPVPPEIRDRFARGKSVVVATFQGGPVTVIPHQP